MNSYVSPQQCNICKLNKLRTFIYIFLYYILYFIYLIYHFIYSYTQYISIYTVYIHTHTIYVCIYVCCVYCMFVCMSGVTIYSILYYLKYVFERKVYMHE